MWHEAIINSIDFDKYYREVVQGSDDGFNYFKKVFKGKDFGQSIYNQYLNSPNLIYALLKYGAISEPGPNINDFDDIQWAMKYKYVNPRDVLVVIIKDHKDKPVPYLIRDMTKTQLEEALKEISSPRYVEALKAELLIRDHKKIDDELIATPNKNGFVIKRNPGKETTAALKATEMNVQSDGVRIVEVGPHEFQVTKLGPGHYVIEGTEIFVPVSRNDDGEMWSAVDTYLRRRERDERNGHGDGNLTNIEFRQPRGGRLRTNIVEDEFLGERLVGRPNFGEEQLERPDFIRGTDLPDLEENV